jgi:hypothetical protein
MKTIEYRITYGYGQSADDEGRGSNPEITRVPARDINSGYTEALRRAKQPLGNGTRREILRIEFVQIV